MYLSHISDYLVFLISNSVSFCVLVHSGGSDVLFSPDLKHINWCKNDHSNCFFGIVRLKCGLIDVCEFDYFYTVHNCVINVTCNVSIYKSAGPGSLMMQLMCKKSLFSVIKCDKYQLGVECR